MSERTEVSPATAAEGDEQGGTSPEAARRRWRDDPLSVFLMGALAVLGLMYLLDGRQDRALASGEAAAKQLKIAALDGGRCAWGTAGASQEVLVIRCRAWSAPETARKLAGAWTAGPPAPWSRVAFRDGEQTIECAGPGARWPDQCARHELPPPERYREARRRRKRTG